jgi:hypothetical protein
MSSNYRYSDAKALSDLVNLSELFPLRTKARLPVQRYGIEWGYLQDFYMNVELDRTARSKLVSYDLSSSVEDDENFPPADNVDPKTMSPYYYDFPIFTPWNVFKVILLTCLGVPIIRLVGFIICALLIIILVNLAMIGHKSQRGDKVTPLPAWRKSIIFWIGRPLGRLALFFLGFHWIPVKGKLEGAPVMVFNHSTFLDSFFIFIHQLPCMIAADFVRTTPFFGTVATAAQAIYVDRDNKKDKDFVLNEMKRRVAVGGTCLNRLSPC